MRVITMTAISKWLIIIRLSDVLVVDVERGITDVPVRASDGSICYTYPDDVPQMVRDCVANFI